MTNDEELRAQAEKRLKGKAAFLRTLLVFFVVWAMMIVIWALTGRGYFWPVWAMFGMGIGLAFMALNTFGPRSSGPTAAQIDAEMKKMKGDES